MKRLNRYLTIIFILIGVIIWQASAQSPELTPPPPPLESVHETPRPWLSLTTTPALFEGVSGHKMPPTVTPYPYKEIIDLTTADVNYLDITEVIIQQSDSSRVKIKLSAEQLAEMEKQGLALTLDLAPGDSKQTYRAQATSEQAFNNSNPHLLMNFYHYHPEYLHPGSGFRLWPASSGNTITT